MDHIFLRFVPNTDCGCSLEPQWHESSSKYQESMFWAKIRKIMYAPINSNSPNIKGGIPGCSLRRLVKIMVFCWFSSFAL